MRTYIIAISQHADDTTSASGAGFSASSVAAVCRSIFAAGMPDGALSVTREGYEVFTAPSARAYAEHDGDPATPPDLIARVAAAVPACVGAKITSKLAWSPGFRV